MKTCSKYPKPQNYLFKFIIASVLVLGTVFISGKLSAQTDNPVEAADTVTKEKKPEPIPIANISTETENTLRMIRQIKEKIQPSSIELRVDSLIPDALEKAVRLKQNINLDSLQGLPLRESEKIKSETSQLRLQLNNYRDVLISKSEEINKLKEKIRETREIWRATLNTDAEVELPEEITSRIQNNLKEIDSAKMVLDERNKYLLVTQDKLTESILFLDEVLNKLSSMEISFVNRLYKIDSPPIWQVFYSGLDTISFGEKVHLSIDHNKKELYFFADNYRFNVYVHIVLFVISLAFFFYIKNVVQSWPEEKKDEETKISMFIITKPISSSLLLSLLLTNILYPMMPQSVMDYFNVLLIIPVIFLIPGIIPGIPRKYFYGIAVYFIFSQLADYFHEVPVLDRLFVLLADIITLIILILILKSKKTIQERDPEIRWPLLSAIIKISVFSLSAGILANIFGNITLSRVMSDGAQAMFYGALIIYSATQVLKGFFALIMRQEHVARLNMVVNYSEEITKRINKIIKIVAIILWLKIIFQNYMLYDPFIKWLGEMLSDEWEIGSVSISLGNILAFIVTIWVSILLAQFIRFLLEDEILTHFDMPRGVPGAIGMIARLIIIIFGFVLAFGAAKIDMSNVSIIIGALGVGIGFGLQNIFNNLVSGLILAFERPIQTGDVVEISNLNLMGTVKEIGIRASTVRTFDGAEVVVPNGNLISNEVVNWTLSDQRRRQEILIGVAYGTDLNKVLEILEKVVSENENVLKNPKPFIIFTGFGDSSLDFRVLFWTSFFNGMGTKSAVGIAIDEAFKKEGIPIPFPQRDLHLVSIPKDIGMENSAPPAPAGKSAGGSAKKTTRGNKRKITPAGQAEPKNIAAADNTVNPREKASGQGTGKEKVPKKRSGK